MKVVIGFILTHIMQLCWESFKVDIAWTFWLHILVHIWVLTLNNGGRKFTCKDKEITNTYIWEIMLYNYLLNGRNPSPIFHASGVFTNTQNWHKFQICIPISAISLFAPYAVSNCEIWCHLQILLTIKSGSELHNIKIIAQNYFLNNCIWFFKLFSQTTSGKLRIFWLVL